MLLVPISELVPKEEQDPIIQALRAAAQPKPELDVDTQLIWQRRKQRYEEILKKAAEDWKR